MIRTRLYKAQFIHLYGNVYESSRWVLEEVWPQVELGMIDTDLDLIRAVQGAVDAAPENQKLKLLQDYPSLVSEKSRRKSASVMYMREQSKAGIDSCSVEEGELLAQLNRAHKERFEIPFIVCLQGLKLKDVLRLMRSRMSNDEIAERNSAMQEVHKIASERIKMIAARGS